MGSIAMTGVHENKRKFEDTHIHRVKCHVNMKMTINKPKARLGQILLPKPLERTNLPTHLVCGLLELWDNLLLLFCPSCLGYFVMATLETNTDLKWNIITLSQVCGLWLKVIKMSYKKRRLPPASQCSQCWRVDREPWLAGWFQSLCIGSYHLAGGNWIPFQYQLSC